MRHKDPEVLRSILEYAEDRILSGEAPSSLEIAGALGISPATVCRYLKALEEDGSLDRKGGRISTPRTRRMSSSCAVPVFSGAIPCGPAAEVEAQADEYVSLPSAIFGDGPMYVIRTTGESMIGAGIEPGDAVVVDREARPRNGDIVVALLNNENTLKRLVRQGDRLLLHPENPAMKDIPVPRGTLKIQGVARFVIKAL